MALTRKREYNVISGIEDPEESNKRIRKYLYKQFKDNPQKFFLEWDKRSIIIENSHQWAFPKPINKIAVFLSYTTSKPKTEKQKKALSKRPITHDEKVIYEDNSEIDLDNDFLYCDGIKNVRILIDTVHSSKEQLKNYCYKKSKTNNKRDVRYYLLLTIHNPITSEDISDANISDVYKAFNREKIRTSFDQRLKNMLLFVVESISNDEMKYQICVRKNAFFNNNIKKNILPLSYEYLSKFYQ